MILSILIPTLPQRQNNIKNLLNCLLPQIKNRKDVEIISLMDNNIKSIGEKRNELIRMASGKYIVFIDDDDLVTKNFIEESCKSLYKNSDCTVAVYDMLCIDSTNHKKKITKFSIKYKKRFEKNGIKYGWPLHVMIWEKKFIEKIYFENKNFGEDAIWSKKVSLKAIDEKVKEIKIKNIYYIYKFNLKSSESRKSENRIRKMKDITVLLPYQNDMPERLINLKITVDYLNKSGVNVIVGSVSSPLPELNCEVIRMPFDKFHYTKILNRMALASKTEILALGDGDVLIPYERIYQGAEMVRSGEFDLVSGYNGHLYNIEAKEYLSEELDWLQEIGDHQYYENVYNLLNLTNTAPFLEKGGVGGCMFYKKSTFFKCGMENENFYGYGFMDNERIDRAIKLGYKYGRVDGPMYHLKHPVTHFKTSKEIKNEMKKEFIKIHNMNKKELIKYIKTWTWNKGKYNVSFL